MAEPSKHRYTRVLNYVATTPWAVLPETLGTILEVVQLHAEGHRFTDEELQERLSEAASRRAPKSSGSIAVIPLFGVLIPRADMFSEMSGGTSMKTFQATFKAAVADESIGSILIISDSPGGSVDQITETAALIRDSRGQKPIVGIADSMAASAAYHVMSAVDHLALTPSGQVGSIGVLAAHTDISEMEKMLGVKTILVTAGDHKAEFNPFEPLTDEARFALQQKVDSFYKVFVDDVAAGRGVSRATVLADFGQGRMLTAADALAAGMVDEVATFDQVVAEMQSGKSARSRSGTAALAENDTWPANTWSRVLVGDARLAALGFTGSTGVAEISTHADTPTMTTRKKTSEQAPETPPENDTPEPKEVEDEPQAAVPSEPEPKPEAQPRSEPEGMDEIKSTVSALTSALAELKSGNTDRQKVEQLAKDLAELQKQNSPKTGYRPDDEEGAGASAVFKHLPSEPNARLKALHSKPAAKVAPMARIPAERVTDFQEKADNLLLVAAALDCDPRETAYFADEYVPSLYAALNTQDVGGGSEFVPTMLSNQLIERVNLELVVANLFPQIDMPSSPFEIPGFGVSRVRGGSLAENLADTGQTAIKKLRPGTRKIQLVAMKFAGETLVSKEEEEESIIAILPFMQDELVEFLAADIEEAIIDGDMDGTQDSDIVALTDPRLNFEGLRKVAAEAGIATIDGAGAACSLEHLRLNRKSMRKYGARAARLFHLLSIAAYVDLIADDKVRTIDKYGPQATIISGELAKADGVPVVVSEYVRQDLNVTGVFQGGTNNRTEALTVYQRGFVVGRRRGITLQRLVELYAEFDQDAIIATTRVAFAARFPTDTEPVVAVTYNLGATAT